jgi:carbazole 1,9a-dioxygenase terminal dioxygenase component
MTPSIEVSGDLLARIPASWRGYVAAKLGFKNHWYPVLRSEDLREREPLALKLLGDSLLLNRLDGEVHAIRDRCLHRGAPFSKNVQCLTPDTVTCWYHAWTYNWKTGDLVQILADPGSRQIGKQRLRTYPVREAKGLIFVFVGDRDADVPDLARDVPPGFLDERRVGFPAVQVVRSNWRVGAENGFDGAHIWIHRNSKLVKGNNIVLPLGFLYRHKEHATLTRIVSDGDGPYGVYDLQGEGAMPVWEGKIGNHLVATGNMGDKRVATEVSIWLPSCLKVDPWPQDGSIQFEWYVPRDADTHHYVQCLTKLCADDTEAAAFRKECEGKWVDMSFRGFNDDDVFAREALQDFYGSDMGWMKEVLFEADVPIIEWRKLAAKLNRGVQTFDDLY